MHFHLEQPLPASADAVVDVLIDPAFLASMAELPRLGRPEVLEQRESAGTVHQRVRYRFAGSLSSTVTKVVDPAKLVWVNETTYDRAHGVATFRIIPDHYVERLRAGGTYHFVETGPQACLRIADGEIVVRFPFVGKAVERAIVSGVQEHLAHEAALVAGWLDGGRAPR